METMQQPTVNHSTFTLERSFPASPERVFSAFSDPAKKIRWFADGSRREAVRFDMDFRVGGNDHIRYQTALDSPLKGAILSNETHYLEIQPNRRIVIAYGAGHIPTLQRQLAARGITAQIASRLFVPAGMGTMSAPVIARWQRNLENLRRILDGSVAVSHDSKDKVKDSHRVQDLKLALKTYGAEKK